MMYVPFDKILIKTAFSTAKKRSPTLYIVFSLLKLIVFLILGILFVLLFILKNMLMLMLVTNRKVALIIWVAIAIRGRAWFQLKGEVFVKKASYFVR